jgi:hypothetical protein
LWPPWFLVKKIRDVRQDRCRRSSSYWKRR